MAVLCDAARNQATFTCKLWKMTSTAPRNCLCCGTGRLRQGSSRQWVLGSRTGIPYPAWYLLARNWSTARKRAPAHRHILEYWLTSTTKRVIGCIVLCMQREPPFQKQLIARLLVTLSPVKTAVGAFHLPPSRPRVVAWTARHGPRQGVGGCLTIKYL